MLHDAKQGQSYYVATARHVLKNPDSYEIITPDSKRYAVQLVQPEDMKSKGTDAALIKFTSNETYSVASIYKYKNSEEQNRIQLYEKASKSVVAIANKHT